MKQFVIVLLASLMGVLIALVAHDRLVVAPREAARQDERQVSLDRAQGQADQIAQKLDASVERSVTGARHAMDALAAEQERRALAAEALARASMLKTALAEYYLTEGRWPRNGAEAGIAESAEFVGGGVSGIDVMEGGRIAIRLNERVAADARFLLSPHVSEGSGMIRWSCRFEGAPEIASRLAVCRD